MRNQLALVLLASAVAACQTTRQPVDNPARGLAPVNVPVVARTDYAIDMAAPDGSLAPSEAARLDAWFRGLNLGYGDSIHVDGAYAEAARGDVARIAGQYGMLVNAGVPVTNGTVPPGMVRVIVSRTRATVPGCPNWSRPAQPNWDNANMSNFGCGVNSNVATMVADPNDLLYGRGGDGVVDADAAAKAIRTYRTAKPTGEGGLPEINTKGN